VCNSLVYHRASEIMTLRHYTNLFSIIIIIIIITCIGIWTIGEKVRHQMSPLVFQQTIEVCNENDILIMALNKMQNNYSINFTVSVNMTNNTTHIFLSPLIFLQNTRGSTHTYHSRRQKFCCRRTARVKQFTDCYITDHQLCTV